MMRYSLDEDDAAPHHHIRRRVSLGVEAGGCLLRFAPQALRHASGEPPASSMVCRPALGLPKPAAEVLRRLQRRLGASVTVTSAHSTGGFLRATIWPPTSDTALPRTNGFAGWSQCGQTKPSF